MSEAPSTPPTSPRKPPASNAMRPLSAARLPSRAAQGKLSARLRAALENWGLNVIAITREALEDFRTADRYFKLKVGIVAGWLLLSSLGIIVACPPVAGPRNDIGAELTIAGESDSPVLMIQNASDETWENVIVVVNGIYRLSVARLEAGTDVTFGPKQLIGPNGTFAPPDLRVTELEVRTEDDDAVLMRGGEKL